MRQLVRRRGARSGIRWTPSHDFPASRSLTSRGQTSQPYRTVATATTTRTGYYYANWFVWNDVDVRVAFISPYQSIASTYRWLRTVDVR
jgi:hypothetical protein